jgi:hypothetical protein
MPHINHQNKSIHAFEGNGGLIVIVRNESFQFATTMRNMQRDHVRGMWDSDWLPNISGKQVSASQNSFALALASRLCNLMVFVLGQLGKEH